MNDNREPSHLIRCVHKQNPGFANTLLYYFENDELAKSQAELVVVDWVYHMNELQDNTFKSSDFVIRIFRLEPLDNAPRPCS